jgi:Lrp/AsnC family leucine-responsive transcriptional regulator
MLDKTDIDIICILKENSKLQLKDIGERVHLTGQAVSNRIMKLEETGVIKGYTVVLDDAKLGNTILAYITVIMKTTDHSSFQKFIKENSLITEASRISGEGCYLLKAVSSSQDEINIFLDKLLKYGNYKINISIGKIK